jgi:hypothetical protein
LNLVEENKYREKKPVGTKEFFSLSVFWILVIFFSLISFTRSTGNYLSKFLVKRIKNTKQFKRQKENLSLYTQAFHWNRSMWRGIILIFRENSIKNSLFHFSVSQESTEEAHHKKEYCCWTIKTRKTWYLRHLSK